MQRLRPAAEAVLDALEGGEAPLYFIAPTGYGKTLVVLEAVERLYPTVPAFTHALPLRAIIEQVYRRALDRLPVAVGYQAGGLLLGGKSPFMGAVYNVVTYDSLLYNLYRVNVAEHSLGHYEVPRAHILTSLVALDEIHLGLGGLAASLSPAVEYLAKTRTPLLIETATMPPRLFELVYRAAPGRVLIPSPRGGFERGCERLLAPGAELEEVPDPDYYDAFGQLRWRFEALEGLGEVLEGVVGDAERGLRVLLVARGPREAVEAYRRLRGLMGGRVGLLHGRLAAADRRSVVERLEAGDYRVLVGTSAVEAGVDIDFDVLYTSVDGPADSPSALVQRMGRIARRPDAARRLSEARVVFYGGRARKAAGEWSTVDPRLPCDAGGRRGYARLLEEGSVEGWSAGAKRLRGLLLSHPYVPPASLAALLELVEDRLCDVVREELLVSVAAAELLGCSCNCPVGDDALAAATLPLQYSRVRRMLGRREGPRLAVRDGRVCAVVAEEDGLAAKPVLEGRALLGGCRAFIRALREKRVVALVAEGYRRGEGLV